VRIANNGGAHIALPVRLVEPLGKDTLLYFDAATERAFVAVAEGLSMSEVPVGARLGLMLDEANLHLFDPSGRRITRAA
jgi:ABC-type sugar transport system ATPase subunit